MTSAEDAAAAAKLGESALCFVAIGASGGAGLDDIVELLGALPYPLKAIVLVVLHRPTDRLSHLQSILSRSSRMPVVIADEGQNLQTGTCYIGEPDKHITLIDHHLAHLVLDTTNLLRNRTIDALFESLAARVGRRTIGVVCLARSTTGRGGWRQSRRPAA
jgi:chemotaxis response regulator CheB